MSGIYSGILQARQAGQKLFAVLVDPDKFDPNQAFTFLSSLPPQTTHIFLGGSLVPPGRTEICAAAIKEQSNLPLILFPGDHRQVTDLADALLFLSLLSGRNPEYLIGQHVKAAGKLRGMNMEVIPTAYLLVDGGKTSAIAEVTNTLPLCQTQPDLIAETALAGEYLGQKLVYLEAGSGATVPIRTEVIKAVRNLTTLPLIVGGGLRSMKEVEVAFEAGADLVVVGNAIEAGTYIA